MSKEMSPERTMLVGAAMEGLLSANGYGQSYSADPEGAAKFYASQAVKLADAAMEIMNPKIPIVPPVTPTPSASKPITQDGRNVG